MRLSSDQLGAIGEVRVDGFPSLGRLASPLDSTRRAVFEERALQAMRYGDALYGIPASQDCLSLIFNKALFDAQGLAYPDETWTEQDLLDAAELLTYQDVQGLAIPIKTAYWWFPIKKDLVVHFLMKTANQPSTPTVPVKPCDGCSIWSWSMVLSQQGHRLKG